jgi:hypothetical protein
MTQTLGIWSQLKRILTGGTSSGRASTAFSTQPTDMRPPKVAAMADSYDLRQRAQVEAEGARDEGAKVLDLAEPTSETASVPVDPLSPTGKQSILNEISRLYYSGQYARAAEICEHHFRDHVELRDGSNHPIYYTVMLRVCLARGQYGSAMVLADLLQPLLDPGDPIIQIFYARQHVAVRDLGSARRSYGEALAREPGNKEALDWLAQHRVT